MRIPSAMPKLADLVREHDAWTRDSRITPQSYAPSVLALGNTIADALDAPITRPPVREPAATTTEPAARTPMLTPAWTSPLLANDVPFHRYEPELPPLAPMGVQRLHWRAREMPVRIDESTVVAAWTLEGDIPGPIVHTRVGDTVELTITNDAAIPHSMHFYASQIDPEIALLTVEPGRSVTCTFTPKWAGVFMYHCGTAPVLMHVGSGMYGAIVVDPPRGLTRARDIVLVQSEFHLADASGGLRAFDYQKLLTSLPDVVCFNGRPDQYVHAPIRVRMGERVRFWVLNAGPTHPCNFGLLGAQFDATYLGAPPVAPLRGVDTWDVPRGGGACFELLCDLPGEFAFVSHGGGRGRSGAIGVLIVER